MPDTPKRYAILDRDGTINVEKSYLSDPEQLELLPGAVAALHRLRRLGLGLIVVTNQSGVGRGLFSMEDVEAVHSRLEAMLRAEGLILDAIYVCPHHPEAGCACRKPATGLVERAALDFGFNPADCFVIGDHRVDVDLGRAVGATTFLLRTGHGGSFENDPALHPDFVADDLAAAAESIAVLMGLERG
ncbi:MAG: HAD family hydrolase [Proteobacteria bacterium]|nr:HAD family hydrolase [Pseudomonadota bacterium]